jgi:hypothetical protein
MIFQKLWDYFMAKSKKAKGAKPMGGERETTIDVAKRKGDKGEELPGVSIIHAGQANRHLRIHESAGQVHIHDDPNKLKVAVPVARWFKEWERLSAPVMGAPIEWKFPDTLNNTVFEVEVVCEELPPDTNDPIGTWKISANCRVKKLVADVTFMNLNNFTKRK